MQIPSGCFNRIYDWLSLEAGDAAVVSLRHRPEGSIPLITFTFSNNPSFLSLGGAAPPILLKRSRGVRLPRLAHNQKIVGSNPTSAIPLLRVLRLMKKTYLIFLKFYDIINI